MDDHLWKTDGKKKNLCIFRESRSAKVSSTKNAKCKNLTLFRPLTKNVYDDQTLRIFLKIIWEHFKSVVICMSTLT